MSEMSSMQYDSRQYLYDTGMIKKELKELLQRYPYGLQCCDIVKMLAARGIDVLAADLNPLLYRAPFEQVGAARPPFFTFREPAQNQRTYAYFRCDEAPCAAVSATAKAACDEHAFTRSDVSTPAAPDPCAIIAHGQSAPAASDPYVSLQIRDRNAMCMLNTYFQKTTRTNSAFSFGTSSSAPFACALEFAVDGENIKRTVRVYGFPKKSMAHDMAAQRALNIIDAVRMRRHAAACYETAVAQHIDMRVAFEKWYNSYTTMRGERFNETKSDVEYCDGRYSVTLHYEMLRITYDENDAVRSRRAQGVWDTDKDDAFNKIAQLAFQDIAGIPRSIVVDKRLYAPEPRAAPKRCHSTLDFEPDDDDSSDSDDETLMTSIAELAAVERAAKETLKRNLATLVCNDDEPCPELVSANDHRGVVVPRTAEHARLLERERAVSLAEKFVAVARTEDAHTATKAPALPERRVPPLASFRLTKKESRDALDEYYSALSGKAGWNISTTDGNGLRGCDITFDVEADLARYTMSVSGFELWHDAVTSAVELVLDVIDAVRMQQHAGASYDACVAKGAGVSMFDEFSKWYTGYCTMRGEEFSGMKLDQWNEISLLPFTMTCKALYVDVAGNRVIRSLRSMHAICTEPKQAMDLVAKRMWLHIAGRQYTDDIIEAPTPTANVSNIPLDCRELSANERHVEKRMAEAIPLPKRRVPPPASFRLTATDPREALDEYYRAMPGKAGWSFSTMHSAKDGFGVDAEFDVESELARRKVSVKGFNCYKEAVKAAAKIALDVIDAVRMQKHAAECLEKCVLDEPGTRKIPCQWFTIYCTMRNYGIPWTKTIGSTLSAKIATCVTFKYWHIDKAGGAVTLVDHTVTGIGKNEDDSLNDAMSQAVTFIAFGDQEKSKDAEKPDLPPLSNVPNASDDRAQHAKQTVGCIACSVFDPPKDRQCDVCVTINDMHLHADKSKRHEPCRDTVFTPSFPVGFFDKRSLMDENSENDKSVDNNVLQVANRTDAMRNFIVFHFAYQPTAALNAYQHALTGTGTVQTTVESADHKFTYTLSFNVEGELAKRIVRVRDYTCAHKTAQNEAATRALNIIDAVRMRLDAVECLAKCAEDEPTTCKIPRQWFTSYHTMRSYSRMPWAVVERGSTLNADVSTSILFAYWRVDDDGDNARLVEHSVTGVGKTLDDSLNDAMRQAVVIIAFNGQKSDANDDTPAAATPSECAAAAPKEFESTASNVQRLHALCCALDPAKDNKIRSSYSAFESEIAGKIGVYAMMSSPDGGGVTYRSPHIIIGEVCDTVFEAKEMAAHYVLCWIGARIFGIACSQQIEDTSKK